MKQLNENHLPARVIRLLPERYRPNPNRMGVTQLIDSPRIRTLLIKEWDNIVADYSDLLSTIIGLSVHDRAEKFATEDEEAEQKLEFAKDSKGNKFGLTLVGKADNYVNGEIIDTKTKAVGFKKFGLKKEEQQLNIYAWMQRMNFNQVDKLILDIYYRDHKLSEAKFKQDYPQISYESIELPLWSFEEQEQFIWNRLYLHNTFPMSCTNEDRWKKEDSYAVMVGNRKRAERVLSSEKEAQEWIDQNGRGDNIVKRPGESTRCDNYCAARSVCSFAKGDKK